MSKNWRWLALGAVIGLVAGWLILRRRLAGRPQIESGARQEEGREDRIVLPLARTARSEGSVKGEITLPGGKTLEAVESERPAVGGDAVGSRPDTSEVAEPEDDRIELPLHAAGGRPMVGEMNGAEQPEGEDALQTDTGDEVIDGSEDATALPDRSVEAYCVRCKTQRPMVRVTQYVTSKNRAALKGECSVCGAGMFKFIKEE